MPRIPHLIFGLLIGSAVGQFASGRPKVAGVCLILFVGALLYNYWRIPRHTGNGVKKPLSHAKGSAPKPFPLLKIFTICTAGSCSLAIAASSYLYLTTFATVFIALILTLTTTIISLILFHLNTQ